MFVLLFVYRSDAINSDESNDDLRREFKRELTTRDAERHVLAEGLDALRNQVEALCIAAPDLDPDSPQCQPVTPPSDDLVNDVNENVPSVIITGQEPSM